MFRMEEWQNGEWVVVRTGIPEWERAGLLEANAESGNIYSDTDPAPEDVPTDGRTVYRFVDTP